MLFVRQAVVLVGFSHSLTSPPTHPSELLVFFSTSLEIVLYHCALVLDCLFHLWLCMRYGVVLWLKFRLLTWLIVVCKNYNDFVVCLMVHAVPVMMLLYANNRFSFFPWHRRWDRPGKQRRSVWSHSIGKSPRLQTPQL